MSASPHIKEQPCRALWAQVVLQAKEDLEDAPVSSVLYDQAVAFFVGRGHWAESRAVIADLLEMHPDYLCSSGTRWIAERREREGLPPEQPPTSGTEPGPLPRLEALPGPDRRARRAHLEHPGQRHDVPPSVARQSPDSTPRRPVEITPKRPNNWRRWAETGEANPFARRW